MSCQPNSPDCVGVVHRLLWKARESFRPGSAMLFHYLGALKIILNGLAEVFLDLRMECVPHRQANWPGKPSCSVRLAAVVAISPEDAIS